MSVVPTSYLAGLRTLLRSTEPELWQFFASAPRVEALVQQVRDDLLRSTYRLEEPAHAPVLHAAGLAAQRLGVGEPVTLYQAREGTGAQGNASVFSLPGEVHVVFSGPVLELLDDEELHAVLGHELAHHVLWTQEDGDFWVLDRLVHASAEDLEAAPAHLETARLLRLNTEVVADRGALLAADGDLEVAVAALVKLDTGLRAVSGQAYLRQAEEVLAGEQAAPASGSTHPEGYLRAWALAGWAKEGVAAEPEIAARLAGAQELHALDLVGQHALTGLTQRLARQFVEPAWARTGTLVGHARNFGVPAVPPAPLAPLQAAELEGLSDSLREYLAYVLLDLATVDEAVEEPALASALLLSAQLGLADVLDRLVGKELALGVRTVRARRKAAPDLLAAQS